MLEANRIIPSNPFCYVLKPAARKTSLSELDASDKKIVSENNSFRAGNKPNIFLFNSVTRIELNEGRKLLQRIGSYPAIWQMGNLVVVGNVPKGNKMNTAKELIVAASE